MSPRLSRRLILGAAALTLTPRFTRAAEPLKVVGYFDGISEASPSNAINVAAFRRGLADEGFVEGKNVKIVFRFADGQLERLPALAQELIAQKVDVLAAITPDGARAAMKLTKTIPIVFGQAGDAVDNGMVKNLDHPEANVTGISNRNELGPKRFEMIAALIPGAPVIAYVSDPGLGSYKRNLEQTAAAAKALKRDLRVLDATTEAEIAAAFAAIGAQNIRAMYLGPIQGASRRPEQVVALAARYNVPAVYFNRAFVDVGGLMSFGVAFDELRYYSGVYAGKMLKGAKPGDLPVLRGKRFEFALNDATAKALKLTIPPAIQNAVTDHVG